MKIKTLIVGLCLALGSLAQAQQLQENQSALVYYMPYTWVSLELTYTETTATVGPFVQYAERYLGTKDVVLEDNITYCLTSASLTTSTTADKQRAYTIPMTGKDKSTCYIGLNPQGILLSINADVQPTDYTSPDALYQTKEEVQTSQILPLLEEQMIANSTAKMAEGAARQIYRIRETRLNILSGDVEHVPADGEAMKQVLAELDKQEKALTALFVGTKQTRTLTKHYTIDPAKQQDGILFRFSKFAGPVAADDLSGEPYTLAIQKHKRAYAEDVYGEESKKKEPAPTIFYNLSGEATITLSQAGNTLLTQTFPVAQFGISVPMDLTKMRDTEVRFDEHTGMILSIVKTK